MKKLLAFAGLFALLGSCVVATDDNCPEAAVSCDGEIIEECVDDTWLIVEDCFDLCGGFCDFDGNGNPVCVC
jgi:hypothetical protein